MRSERAWSEELRGLVTRVGLLSTAESLPANASYFLVDQSDAGHQQVRTVRLLFDLLGIVDVRRQVNLDPDPRLAP